MPKFSVNPDTGEILYEATVEALNVKLSLESVAGSLVVREMLISTTKRSGVTTVSLRKLALAKLVHDANRRIAKDATLGENFDKVSLRAVEKFVAGQTRHVGRRGRPDVFYAAIASAVIRQAKTSAAPLRDVAKRLGRDPSSIEGFLRTARQRGILSYPPEGSEGGKFGGELTDKGKALLPMHDEWLKAIPEATKTAKSRTNKKRGK